MFNFIKQMFGDNKKPEILSRLTESDAIKIACEADIAADHKELMTMTTLLIRDGKPTWVVNSATIGSMIEVVIDDETGKIIKAGRVGKR